MHARIHVYAKSMTNTAATATIDTDEFAMLKMYPTIEAAKYLEINTNGTEWTPFTYLLEFARQNDLSLRHDTESHATCQGWYVEDIDGRQVYAATITTD